MGEDGGLSDQGKSPGMAATEAEVAMDAEKFAAVRAGPSNVLPCDERADSNGLDGLEIVDQAHVISFAVTLVEAPQAGAWESGAIGAEAVWTRGNGAVPDGARDAMRRFGGMVFGEAAGAAVFLAEMAEAEGAIDAAGGDHAGAGDGGNRHFRNGV